MQPRTEARLLNSRNQDHHSHHCLNLLAQAAYMANIGESGIAGKGSMLAGTLEMSNVDLTEQLTDMIVTQRGFQSNAKTIQTDDTLLETVLSLKR